jgi:hypothetical protein
MPLSCPLVDLPGASAGQAAIQGLRTEVGREPFDLTAGPLVAVALARLAPTRHVLYLLAHHIVFDSSSTRLFCRDLAAFYRGEELPLRPEREPVPSVPPNPGFWVRELTGAPVLTLPSGDGAKDTGRGGSLARDLRGGTSERVRELAKAHDATPFMVLVAALAAILGRLSGQDDFMIGIAVSNRPEETAERIGMFIDTVVLRMDLTGNPDFAELLGRVRTRMASAHDHSGVPFDDLVSLLNPQRIAGANPLFGVMVEYERQLPAPPFDPPGTIVTLAALPTDRAPFELSLYLAHGDRGLSCVAEYEPTRFTSADVHWLITFLETVIYRAVNDASHRLSALTASTDADHATIAAQQGARTVESGGCLHQLLEDQRARTPDALAVLAEDRVLTYAQLDDIANALAQELVRDRAGAHGTIAVTGCPGAEMIVAMLAVLKAGRAYVPLPASLPAERLEYCLADCGADTVLLTGRDACVPAGPWRTRTVTVDGPRSGVPWPGCRPRRAGVLHTRRAPAAAPRPFRCRTADQSTCCAGNARKVAHCWALSRSWRSAIPLARTLRTVSSLSSP